MPPAEGVASSVDRRLLSWLKDFKHTHKRKPKKEDMPSEIGLLYDHYKASNTQKPRKASDGAMMEAWPCNYAVERNPFLRASVSWKRTTDSRGSGSGDALAAMKEVENVCTQPILETRKEPEASQSESQSKVEGSASVFTPSKFRRKSHLTSMASFAFSFSTSSHLQTSLEEGPPEGRLSEGNGTCKGNTEMISNPSCEGSEKAKRRSPGMLKDIHNTFSLSQQVGKDMQPRPETRLPDALKCPSESEKDRPTAKRRRQSLDEKKLPNSLSASPDASERGSGSEGLATSGKSQECVREATDVECPEMEQQQSGRLLGLNQKSGGGSSLQKASQKSTPKAKNSGQRKPSRGKTRSNFVRSDNKGFRSKSFKNRSGPRRGRGKSRFGFQKARGQAGDGADYMDGFEGPKRKGGCYKCGRSGHWASECPENAKAAAEAEDSDDNSSESKKPCTHGISCKIGGSGLSAGPREADTAIDELPQDIQAAIMEAKEGSHDSLEMLLQTVFGHQQFRGLQESIIQRTIQGKSTLAILPTGAGKSLCYQLPALVQGGLTLVISPLIALMRDQLNHLPSALPAAMLWSGQSKVEAMQTLTNLKAGKLRILFVAPERLQNTLLLEALGAQSSPPLVVIDEAHCVAEWGHNFRSAYFRLGHLLKTVVPCRAVLALTATATQATQASICETLGIAPSEVIMESVLPSNLRLTVTQSSGPESAKEELLALLSSLPEGGTAIVYTTFQAQADQLATNLCFNGFKAASYHSGKFDKEREKVQQEFCCGKLKVVVATLAFGMGLDAAHVRSVVHMNMPRSLEEYVQQVGRAGRGGGESHCHLFMSASDFQRLRSLAHSDAIDKSHVRALLEHVFGESAEPNGGEAASKPYFAVLEAKKASQELDMKEEVVETLLSYIEASEEGFLRILPPCAAAVKVYFYKLPEDLAEGSELVAALLRVTKERAGCFSAGISDLCNEFAQPPSEVLKALQGLAKAELIRFELLQTQSLACKVLRKPGNLRALATALARRHEHSCRQQVSRLDRAYRDFAAAAKADGGGEQERMLRDAVTDYFGAVSSGAAEDLAELPLEKAAEKDIAMDVRAVLVEARKKFGPQASKLPPRAVARILHGLNSASCPAKVWSTYSCWGRYSNVAFSHVLVIAEKMSKPCTSV